MYEYLDRRYAQALYEIAEKKGTVEKIIGDLKEICKLIEDDKQFSIIINHPQISMDRKKEIFSELFKGKIDDDLLSFLCVLIEKGRIGFLREKLNQLEEIDLEKKNTIRGIVKTAVPLTEVQYNKLLMKLEAMYEKKIILEEVVDKNVIGGLYIKVKDDIIDGTISSRYKDIKNTMLAKK